MPIISEGLYEKLSYIFQTNKAGEKLIVIRRHLRVSHPKRSLSKWYQEASLEVPVKELSEILRKIST